MTLPKGRDDVCLPAVDDDDSSQSKARQMTAEQGSANDGVSAEAKIHGADGAAFEHVGFALSCFSGGHVLDAECFRG